MFPGLSWHEFVIVGVIAILLFGKRLPDVAKKLGGSYREFRRGLSEFQGQVDISDLTRSATYASPSPSSSTSYVPSSADDYDEPTAPRFEPPPAEPTPPGSDPAAP